MAVHRIFLGSSTEGEKKARWLADLLMELGEVEFQNAFEIVGWWETSVFPGDKTYIEALFTQLAETDSALLLATADDRLDHRGKVAFRPRDNIILEYGMWAGKFGREKTALAILGDLELPSDLTGMRNLKLKDQEDIESFKKVNTKQVRAWLKSLRSQTMEGRGRVFVMFPSLRDDPFYLELLAGLAATLQGHYDLALFVPKEAYSATQYISELEDIDPRRNGYVGGIIRPMLVDEAGDKLREIVRNWRIPTVFVDINAFEGEDLPEYASYVGFDNREGGRLAAQAMSHELKGERNSRVLVVASEEQRERYEAFMNELDVEPKPKLEKCPFSRDKARACVQKVFKRQEHPYDGIFCSSDAMALGATWAVTDVCRTDEIEDIVIIGYDGIAAAKTLIDLPHSPFRNTVIQDTYKLGEKAALLLRDMIKGTSLPQVRRVQILDVQMYIEQ